MTIEEQLTHHDWRVRRDAVLLDGLTPEQRERALADKEVYVREAASNA